MKLRTTVQTGGQMSVRNTVTAIELRSKKVWDEIFDLLEERPDHVIQVTRYGKPICMIISNKKYEELTNWEGEVF